MVVRALEALDPDAVLVEGPADASGVVGLAGLEGMRPPVALLVYEPECPSESAYYPLAEFSPEWQAMRWGLSRERVVRFIDLPRSLRVDAAGDGEEAKEEGGGDADGVVGEGDAVGRGDPLESLARAAGYPDGEAWWSRLIEERGGDEDPLGVFDAIREAMGSAREALGDGARDAEESAREAHMRRSIRAALKGGFGRIGVVCGAWHAPALTEEALGRVTVKGDDAALRGLRKRKTAATWIPWTYGRLAVASGYRAGVASPGWYDHLWAHGVGGRDGGGGGAGGGVRDGVCARWMTRVARLMRDEDLEASPAGVIESVRLAECLAAMRGRSIAGLDELGEATLSILCHGNPLPMRVIERDLIVGERLGEVPEEVPTVPLQRDLAGLQKSLRMRVSATEAVLDLDLRKDLDLSRSRLLHRLAMLGIGWGVLGENQMQRTSTFHEIWTVQWRPEFAVSVMEAARWGNTVAEAASRFVGDRCRRAASLDELTGMLDHVMLADLPEGVEALIGRIRDMSAVASDVGHLMDALPPLARVMRYGNVRGTDAGVLEPVIGGLLSRVCAGLSAACGSLDDDAAGVMVSRMDAVHAALRTLDVAEFLDQWMRELRRVGDASVHGLVGGRAWRLLLDSGGAESEEAASRMSRWLSVGNDPGAASAWLEGFLSGSGMVLVHDARLLSIVDGWVCSLSRDAFERACPIARRTFSTFERAERRMIGERVARDAGGGSGSGGGDAREVDSDAGSDGFDAERSALVDPVLRLILGDLP